MDPAIGPNTYETNLKAIQPGLINFPVTVDNQGVNRKFRSEWYTKFDWLEYSASKDIAFCLYCRIFGSKCVNFDASYTSLGMNSWNKATIKFPAHQKTTSHLNAAKLLQCKLLKLS